MKKPYFLGIARIYDNTQDYERQTEPKLFTPSSAYYYAQKHPGETITIEIEVYDWDTTLYANGTNVDIYCGESYGRS